MKKVALLLLLVFAICFCATRSYSGKPVDTIPPDVKGVYDGTITRFSPLSQTLDELWASGTIIIWGQSGSHFWGNLEFTTTEGGVYSCYPLNGVILEDNTIYYIASGRPVYGKFMPATRTTAQRIETVTLRETGENSHGSYTYTGPAPETYSCP